MSGKAQFNVKFANVTFSVSALFESTKDFCREYVCEDVASESICITEKDVQAEKKHFEQIDERDAELHALHRKISHSLMKHNVFLFHGSAINIDGECIIFTAPSGTGKSTHAEKWHRLFGASYVNDDKPLIEVGERIVAHGSAWMGEHKLGENVSVPVKAVCVVVRSDVNRIESVPQEEVFFRLINQAYAPKDKDCTAKVVELIKSMAKRVNVYRLYCNTDDESAIIAKSFIDKG